MLRTIGHFKGLQQANQEFQDPTSSRNHSKNLNSDLVGFILSYNGEASFFGFKDYSAEFSEQNTNLYISEFSKYLAARYDPSFTKLHLARVNQFYNFVDVPKIRWYLDQSKEVREGLYSLFVARFANVKRPFSRVLTDFKFFEEVLSSCAQH